jgi:rod shape-determining protein MreD
MIKIIARALLIIILLAISISIPQFHSAAPNLLFVLLVIYAFREKGYTYLGVALFSGLLLDAYARTAFGSYILAFLIVGLAIRLATETLFRSESDSLLYMAVAITASYLLLIAIVYSYDAFAVRWDHLVQPVSAVYITHTVWLIMIFNLIAAAPIYWLVQAVENVIVKYNRSNDQIL